MIGLTVYEVFDGHITEYQITGVVIREDYTYLLLDSQERLGTTKMDIRRAIFSREVAEEILRSGG